MRSYDDFLGMILIEAEVTDTEQVEVGSTIARKLKLSNVSGTNWDNELSIYIDSEWLEGVGNVGNGSMVAFGGIQWPKPTCYCGDGGYFNNLYDLDGNIIYKGADIRIDTGGTAVTSSQADKKSDIYYDIMGHRIDRVLPGSVYISDGKKFVGR